MRFNENVVLILTEKIADPINGTRVIEHNPRQLRTGVIPQNAMNEVFITVQQHRRHCSLGSFLNRFPLAQQRLKVIDQQLFADAFGFSTDQQSGPRRLH